MVLQRTRLRSRVFFFWSRGDIGGHVVQVEAREIRGVVTAIYTFKATRCLSHTLTSYTPGTFRMY
eukprot:3222206-Rhodomonas_salina.1